MEPTTGESVPRTGLTSSEAAGRKKQFGPNKLREKKGRSPASIFISQFKNPLIYIISAACIISLVLAEYGDALIIGVVIAVDSVLGFVQEYRAEKTVATLRQLLKPIARVIRNGEMIEIDAADIVPGDLVAINPGDRVAADGELIESVVLNVNEAILTGESEPVMKDEGAVVYMGTTALSGRGLMVVTSTGMNTGLGKIAESLGEITESATPLQIRLAGFGRSLTYVVIAISIIILVTGVLIGKDFLQTAELSVVLAIAAIPEGLPIAVTMILVIGMRAVLRRKGLVKKLLAVETLGSVTTICTDKTGTLTEGMMQVARTDFRSDDMAAHVMVLCNDLSDGLEVTLWNYVKTMNLDPRTFRVDHERIYEIPFDSENKYMLTTNSIDGTEVALLKGAPEVVRDFCKMSDNERDALATQFEDWAGSGLKLLGLAYKRDGNAEELSGFTWAGLIGIEDPVRPTAKDAIMLCRRAGIKTKMITGDHRRTAQKVAAVLGLTSGLGKVLEGKDIETMADEELEDLVADTDIFCRVAPHHKTRIVTALQSRQQIVAMIGDGVNDAPALKKANIGVSVGNGTDVAQETASVILLDNNFGTLVNAVEEGRVIFDNIRKVVAYVLSNSFAEIIIIFGAFLLGWQIPLTVAQILWIHLICDGPSDIALGFERAEEGIMDEPPKSLKESVLDRNSRFLIVAISASSALLCLLVFQHFWQVENNIDLGRTIVFAVLGIQQLVYIFSYRSLRTPIWKTKQFLANRPLFIAVGLGMAQQVAALYIPVLNDLLGVVPLGVEGWVIVVGVSLGMMAIVESVKLVARHTSKNGATVGRTMA